jgi:hypothetical protein
VAIEIEEIEDICSLPVWVTEAGASSFGAEEVQVFGLRKTTELLLGGFPGFSGTVSRSASDLGGYNQA